MNIMRRPAERFLSYSATILLMTAVSPAESAQAGSEAAPYMKELKAFAGKTVEQKVQELSDREEIRELISRYAHRVAHREVISDMFTVDGIYINKKDNMQVRGRKELAAFFDNLSPERRRADPLPMIHNVTLEISGDEAVGICSNELRMSENGKSIIASGYYKDQFRRENGHWKFASREVTWFHWVHLQEGWAKHAEPNE
jgi:hypothetical protein